MAKNEDGEPIVESLEQLKKIDDPGAHLLRNARPTVVRSLQASAFFQSLGGYSASRFIESRTGLVPPITSESLMSVPVWLGAAGMVAGVGLGVTALNDRRKLASRLNLQDQIRSEFSNEPVDITLVSKGWGPHNKSFSLRWYGGDNQTAPETFAKLVNRLDYVALMARRNDIETVVIGTSWLREVLGQKSDESDPLSEFGKVANGRSFYVGLTVVTDIQADEEILTMRADTTGALVATLRSHILSNSSDRLVDLIDQDVHRSNVRSLYDTHQNEMSSDTYQSLVQALRLEIAGILDSDVQVSAQRIYTENTNLRSKIRTYSSTQINGHMASGITTGRDAATGTSFTNASAPQELISLTGATDLDELEQRLYEGDTTFRSGLSARIALYSRLLENDFSTEELPSVALGGPDLERQRTFFERMRPPKDSSLSYSRHRPVKTTIALTLLASIGYMGASEVGGIVDALGSSIVRKDYNHYSNSHAVEDPAVGDNRVDPAYFAYRLYETGLTRPLLDAYMAVQVAAFKADRLSNKALATALPQFFSYSPANYRPESFLKTSINDEANGYTDNNGNMSYGDVNETAQDRNTKVYNIKTLSNQSAQGYWQTDSYTYFQIYNGGGGTPPLAGGNDVFAGSDNSVENNKATTYPTAPPNFEHALFKVSTPFIKDGVSGDLEPLHLPFQPGTAVGAARIVETDPDAPMHSKVVGVKLTTGTSQDVQPNVVTALASAHKLSEFSKPVLEYWLVEDESNIQRAGNPFELLIRDSKFSPISSEIQSKTRAALGVSPNASDLTILAKASSKEYSYTPYDDAGVADKATVKSTNAENDFSAVAALTASLPSANCNTSSLTVLAATGGELNGQPINEAAGYASKDGKTLTVGDSHTWLFDKQGAIIDPTPVLTKGKAKPDESLLQDSVGPSLRNAGIALLATLSGVGLFKRRRKIASTAQDVRTIPQQVELRVKAKRFSHALAAIEASLYSRPDSSLPERVLTPNANAVSEKLLSANFSEPDTIADQVKDDERITGRLEKDSVRLLKLYPRFVEAAQRLSPEKISPASHEISL